MFFFFNFGSDNSTKAYPPVVVLYRKGLGSCSGFVVFNLGFFFAGFQFFVGFGGFSGTQIHGF